MIKKIGTAARQELERYFDARVYLDLHVKVKSEWRDDERVLDEMGLRQALVAVSRSHCTRRSRSHGDRRHESQHVDRTESATRDAC